jgi:5-hydroxyisourate hydrolase
MTGQLTTHVLDLVLGRGAASLVVSVERLRDASGKDGVCFADVILDAGGRGVLVAGPAFQPGRYELTFKIGDYHRATGQAPEEPLFLDETPVRFGVADAGAHCHVPLLISHYGYSTYRGG